MTRDRGVALACGVAVGGLSLVWLRQGLHLQGDGLWLLGAEAVGDHGWPGRALAVDDGPARYWALWLFFLALGPSAAALAVVKATLTGVAAGLLVAIARGPWKAAAAVAAWALAPVPLATVLLLGLALARDGRRTTLAGVLAAGLGLHGWVPGLAALAVVATGPGRRAAPIVATLVGLVLGAALTPGPILAPLGDRLATATDHPFAAARTFTSGRLLHLPFGEVETGEALGPAWPGHAGLRALGFRLWMVALVVVPVVAAGRRRGVRAIDPRIALAGLGAIGWLLHPDLRFLGACALLAVPLLLRAAPSRRGPALAVAGILALALASPAAERIWLTLQVNRDGLVVWERPRAEILLARERIRNLERVVGSKPGRTLFWPAQPALPFLFDLELPTRHAVLPRRSADRAAAVAELETAPPDRVLLGISGAGAALRTRRIAPEAWEFLRSHYEVIGDVSGPDGFRALRLHPGQVSRLPLPQQLPDVALSLGNDPSPPLVPDLAVGQTVRLGPADLAGVSVRWDTPGRDLRPRVRIGVWTRGQGGEFTRLLDFFDITLEIPGHGHRSWIRLGPVTGTAGEEVLLTFEAQAPTESPLHLVWHRHDAGGTDLDLYPEGSARINGEPVDADLYLSTYGASPIP